MLDPALLRLRSFDLGSAATVAAGFGFYAYLLTNVLWLQYVWGYDVLRAGLALVPGAIVAALVASRLGPLAERLRLPRLRRAGSDRLGRGLPLVPPAGRAAAGLLGRVDAGPGAQRHRRRGDPAAARERHARGGSRRSLRDGIRRGLERPPARRRHRHRGARGHPRRPLTRHRRRVAARGLGALDRRLPGRRGARPAPGPDPLGARGRGGASTSGRPWCCPRTRRPSGRCPRRVGSADELDLSELAAVLGAARRGAPPARARHPGRRRCRPAWC